MSCCLFGFSSERLLRRAALGGARAGGKGPPTEGVFLFAFPAGKSISPGSSLNSSEEDLRAGVASSQTPSFTAKLGDTRELEAFIADLDQILKEM
ncbi:Response to complement 32-like protein, partial [Ophiophagus hannah]